jgi:hypothetical protein
LFIKTPELTLKHLIVAIALLVSSSAFAEGISLKGGTPVVIYSDLQIDNDIVQAPWILTTITVKNDLPTVAVIEHLTYQIKYGQLTIGTIEYAPNPVVMVAPNSSQDVSLYISNLPKDPVTFTINATATGWAGYQNQRINAETTFHTMQ